MKIMHGLKQSEIRKLKRIFKKHQNIEVVVLYGSRALGKNKPGSDIDLTIKGKLNHHEFMIVTSELDDLMLPFRIDASLYDQIDNNDLIENIERAGTVLYSKEVNVGS